MKKFWIIIIIILVALIVLVVVNNSSRSSGDIKIAALLSMTGDASAWGENAQKAIELAADTINQNGGIGGKKVTVIYEDTAGDPKRAVAAFQKVTTVDNVVAVIGPLNQTEDGAVLPLINEKKIPTIIPGFLPLQSRININNPLMVWMDAEDEAAQLAGHVFNQGVRRVAVIGTLDSWETTVSNAFIKKFTELGGTITEKQIVQPDTADMKLPVTKVVSSNPEAIFLGTYYEFVNSTKILSDLRYQGKLYSIEVDDYLAGETRVWTNGLRFIAPDYYSTDFVIVFEKKYGRKPGLPAGQAYDAANILFGLLKESTSKDQILSHMAKVREYDGVSGKLRIALDGRTSLPTALFELQSGEMRRVLELQ